LVIFYVKNVAVCFFLINLITQSYQFVTVCVASLLCVLRCGQFLAHVSALKIVCAVSITVLC